MKSIEEKIILSDKECQLFIDLFESDNCVIDNYNPKYGKTGMLGVIKKDAIPEFIFDRLNTFNILPFEVKDEMNKSYTFMMHKYGQGDSLVKHRDDSIENYTSIDLERKKRFKTLVFQLSSPSDYSGSDLVIGDRTVGRERGNVVCFNSNLLHEVTELIEGTRYTLVLWLERKDFNLKHLLL
jgi:hypothetical protein